MYIYIHIEREKPHLEEIPVLFNQFQEHLNDEQNGRFSHAANAPIMDPKAMSAVSKLLGFNKVNHGPLQCNMWKPSKLQHNPCKLSLLISELGINMFIIHILFTSQCWFKGNLQKTP